MSIELGLSMSENKRLHMRVALPAEHLEAFANAKLSAEGVVGVTLSDSQFAVRLIIWALARIDD